jgi:ribonuclease T2
MRFRSHCFLLSAILALFILGCGSVAPRMDQPATAQAAAPAESPDAQAGELSGLGAAATGAASAAKFDYYVLALSWSPQHCATPAGTRDRIQCAGPRPFGFIVHGLWPQYERGWPQDCPGPALPAKVIQDNLDIMPSQGLIRHEWSKHGTCSGLQPAAYFALARKAFNKFRAPSAYGKPDREIYVSPAKYKSAWLDANPGLNSSHFAITCSGRFLQEVRICLDRNLNPRPCGSGVRDRCRVPEMIVRPLR